MLKQSKRLLVYLPVNDKEEGRRTGQKKSSDHKADLIPQNGKSQEEAGLVK